MQSAFRPSGGGWGATANLTQPAPEVFRSWARIVMNPAGQAAAVWGRSDGTNSIIQASSATGAGAWQAPVNLSEAGQSAEAPGVAIDASGDIVAAWERPFEGKQVIQAASRPAGGSWGAVTRLSEPGQSAYYPRVAAGPHGEGTVVWERYNGTFTIVQSAVSTPGGTWTGPINLSSEIENSLLGGVSSDAQGNALAVWESHEASTWAVQAAGYDAAGPLANALSIPASGVAGQPIPFSVSPLDVWSALGSTGWGFGDGASTSGASVSHTFAAAGTYPVTLTSTDAIGNATTATATIAISAQRPVISSLRQSASTWRAGSRLATTARRRPVGTTVSFSLNVPARVTVAFTQAAVGRRVAGKCLAPSRRVTRRHRCTRTLTRGALSFSGHAGANRLRFQGRLSRSRRLAPGRYTLTVTAANSAGPAAPRSLTFTIVR